MKNVLLYFISFSIIFLRRSSSDMSYQQWSPLLESQLREWYTSYEMCMVQNSSKIELRSVSAHCENLDGKPYQRPIRCSVGNTWPSRSGFCAQDDIPFSDRDYFRQAVLGYEDAQRKPLRSFFEKLSRENGALLLIGDSVMQQFYSALACELERELVWKTPGKFTNTDELQYVRVAPSSGSEQSGSNAANSNNNNNPAVQIKFLPIYHFVNGRFDRVANASMFHLKKTVESMITNYESLVIVFNVGLHYVDNPVAHFTRADFQSQLTTAFKFLQHFAVTHATRHHHPHGHHRHPAAAPALKARKTVRIFWRETTAQHFPTPNGYWPGERYSNTMKLQCVAINDSSQAADWRNRDIEDIIQKNNFHKIKIIRFYNVTLPLWAGHPNGQLKDCTHFCWTPMLYQSIFQYLDSAMDLPP